MYLGLDSTPKLDCGHDSYENSGHKQSVLESGCQSKINMVQWPQPCPHTRGWLAAELRSHPQILLYQIETRCLGGEDTGYRDPDTVGARP